MGAAVTTQADVAAMFYKHRPEPVVVANPKPLKVGRGQRVKPSKANSMPVLPKDEQDTSNKG